MEGYNSDEAAVSFGDGGSFEEFHWNNKELRRWKRYAARVEHHCQQHKLLQGALQTQADELEEDIVVLEARIVGHYDAWTLPDDSIL